MENREKGERDMRHETRDEETTKAKKETCRKKVHDARRACIVFRTRGICVFGIVSSLTI